MEDASSASAASSREGKGEKGGEKEKEEEERRRKKRNEARRASRGRDALPFGYLFWFHARVHRRIAGLVQQTTTALSSTAEVVVDDDDDDEEGSGAGTSSSRAALGAHPLEKAHPSVNLPEGFDAWPAVDEAAADRALRQNPALRRCCKFIGQSVD